MPENKTKPTAADVGAFLAGVEPEQRRIDGRVILDMMTRLTGEPPVMWGPSIIGFGTLHYRTEAGREGDIGRIGFAPRKAQLVLYLAPSMPGRDALLTKLGKHSTGKGARYTRSRKPVRVLASFELAGRSEASRAEYRVKRLSAAEKRALIAGALTLDAVMPQSQAPDADAVPAG